MPTTTDLTALAELTPARRLGEVLRGARWGAGLSRAEVAAATGDLVGVRLLSAVERGRRRPSRAQLELLDELYGVDLSRRLGPTRVVPVIDLDARLLELGLHRIELTATDDTHVLDRYLHLLASIRGTT